jgi:anti-sigma-K factor RskA
VNDDTRDLLGAWALDAVDDLERAAVERALRDDPQLADEARALTETAALLAVHGAVAPPATLRAAVLDRIATETQAGAPTPRRTTTRRTGARWLAVAAAFLVATGVPTVIAVQQSQRADQAQQQADQIADILGRPGAQVVQADVTGGGRAVAVIADGAAV